MENVLGRFWGKVKKERGKDACWLWQGSSWKGRARFSVNRKSYHAARWLFQELYGPLPSEVFVCHTCDNPMCVRPSHLFPGTALDNVRDMVAKGRNKRGDGRLLSWPLVADIRYLGSECGVDVGTLAIYYEVTHTAIKKILTGAVWRNCPKSPYWERDTYIRECLRVGHKEFVSHIIRRYPPPPFVSKAKPTPRQLRVQANRVQGELNASQAEKEWAAFVPESVQCLW